MGLYKRGKVWWMAISHQGRQIRRPTGTANRRLAEAILAKVTVTMIEGRFFDTLEEKERTFKEMMERYMREVASKKAPKTHQRHQSSLKHLLPYFGEKPLAEVNPKLISAYKVKRHEEKASAETINKELGLMKAAFNVAILEWEWCRDNPVRRVAMERVNNTRVRYLTDEEFGNLLGHCPDWLKPIVLVARYTGMRRENIVTLKWNQIDLSRKVIILQQTKNGDRLGMPLCEKLVKLLKAMNRRRDNRSDYVFKQADGSPYNGSAVGVAFGRVCRKKAGISDFRFHDLRHTFASCLVQKGVDLYRVQRLLGHRDGRVTQRYAHLSPENLREAVEAQDQSSYHNFITVMDREQAGNRVTP
ncbi:MAG: tyrosine-type recombinase/integrase [Nitrospiria bacterium]